METLRQVVSAISIHALLAESDGLSYFYIIKITDFYPRSPCGERRVMPVSLQVIPLISIHALLAESDHLFASSGVDFAISIHALLAESDKIPY